MPGHLQQRRASADANPYTAIHTSGCMIYTAPAPHSSKEASRPRPWKRGTEENPTRARILLQTHRTSANACSCRAVQCLRDAIHATRMACRWIWWTTRPHATSHLLFSGKTDPSRNTPGPMHSTHTDTGQRVQLSSRTVPVQRDPRHEDIMLLW